MQSDKELVEGRRPVLREAGVRGAVEHTDSQADGDSCGKGGCSESKAVANSGPRPEVPLCRGPVKGNLP